KAGAFGRIRPNTNFQPGSLAEGWGAYWDDYYRQAELIPGVFHVHTGDLDDDMAATGLLNALGVPADRQRLPKLRRLNTSADTLVSLPRV
ncbi:MAG: hypothetical protein K2Q20_00460, partial [Phycisphaerales bacterium]|nr:hypothetical protein [Phycisphaerales bacterium]